MVYQKAMIMHQICSLILTKYKSTRETKAKITKAQFIHSLNRQGKKGA